MAFLQDDIRLYVALAFVLAGVSGVALGLGFLLVNRQIVIGNLREETRQALDEARAGFRRDLEMQMVRMRAQGESEMAELKAEVSLARQEARMNSSVALTWQRRVEDLEKQLAAGGVNFNVAGDATIAGDVAGRDKSTTRK